MSESRLSLSRQDAEEVCRVDELAQSGARGVPELVGRLTHPSWAVRRAVVGALARVGAPAIEPLCWVLRERRDDEARLAAAVDALVACRADVDAAVLALTEPPHSAPVVCDAAQILGRRKSFAAAATLEALTRHADDNVAVAAIEALGRIGGGAGVDALLELVASKNFFRTFPAVDVLGRSGDARAAGALLPLLHDPVFAVEAVRALSHIGDAASVVPLLDHLLATHVGQIREIAVALTRIHRFQEERFGAARLVEEPIAHAKRGDLIAGLLLSALAGADEPEQAAIAFLLGLRPGPAAVQALFSLLAGCEATAAAAAASLRRLGRAIDPHLLERLPAADSAERLRLLPLVSARSLGETSIAACLADPDPAVRVAACEALGRTGNTSAVAALFERLSDPDRRVEQAATSALQSLGSAQTEALALAAARSEDVRLRRTAIRIIAYFGYPSGLAPLLEGARGEDERLRDAAIGGLAFIDDDRARQAVFAAARHESPRTRAAAIRALGNQAPDAISAISAISATSALGPACLLAALQDTDAWVRYYACQSIGKLRYEEYAHAIVALVDDPAGQVRVGVIDALSQLHCPEAVEALEHAAVNENPDVRRAALMGLGLAQRPASIPTLIDALEAPDAVTRLVAIAAIAAYEGPIAIASLRRGAVDEDPGVSAAAIGFLGHRPGPEATEALIDLLAGDLLIGASANGSAGAADRPSLREPVMKALARPMEGRLGIMLAGLEVRRDELAPWLVAALARMGSAEAEGALAAALKAPAPAARRAAAAALAERSTAASRLALESAASDDTDQEVRRIALFALAAQSE